MFKGIADMGKMMKAAQEMQTKMEKLQEDLAAITVTGESGAGMVKAISTAKGELTGLDIDPSIFNADDKEVVEDLILAAIKDAQAKAQEKSQEEMSKLTEGMGLPPGMKLPF
ncbi:MAG: YbaB/EbfC family nucleoid-associated protein [Pseudomonadota bacterium]